MVGCLDFVAGCSFDNFDAFGFEAEFLFFFPAEAEFVGEAAVFSGDSVTRYPEFSWDAFVAPFVRVIVKGGADGAGGSWLANYLSNITITHGLACWNLTDGGVDEVFEARLFHIIYIISEFSFLMLSK